MAEQCQILKPEQGGSSVSGPGKLRCGDRKLNVCGSLFCCHN